jgi:hypothetical protein
MAKSLQILIRQSFAAFILSSCDQCIAWSRWNWATWSQIWYNCEIIPTLKDFIQLSYTGVYKWNFIHCWAVYIGKGKKINWVKVYSINSFFLFQIFPIIPFYSVRCIPSWKHNKSKDASRKKGGYDDRIWWSSENLYIQLEHAEVKVLKRRCHSC